MTNNGNAGTNKYLLNQITCNPLQQNKNINYQICKVLFAEPIIQLAMPRPKNHY